MLLLLDKPEAEQDDAERDNNDSSSIHEKLNVECRMSNDEFFFRHRVMPAAAPRMTAANPLHRQPPARHRALRADRVHRILRARRRETAAAGGAEEKNLCG